MGSRKFAYLDDDPAESAIATGTPHDDLANILLLWQDTFDWQIESPSNPNGLPTATVLQNYDTLINGAQQGQFSGHGAIVLTHEINGATMDLVMSERK